MDFISKDVKIHSIIRKETFYLYSLCVTKCVTDAFLFPHTVYIYQREMHNVPLIFQYGLVYTKTKDNVFRDSRYYQTTIL